MIRRELGRGGMGVVYEAEQDLPRRRVALKTLLHARPERVALFRNEVQAMAEVLHPGIPQIYEVFEADGRVFAAMELVEGDLLLDAVAARYATLDDKLGLLLGITDAVAHANARGVVHRDLKPSNVLVTHGGQPKVIDFGIARVRDVDGPRGSGTVNYVAPEQLAGEEGDARADVYSLGALAWCVLLGEPPVATQGMDVDATIAAKRVPLTLPLKLPIEVGAILVRALAPRPEDRYANAADLADDLKRYIEHRPVRALGLGPWQEIRAFRRRRGRLLGRATGAAVLLGLLAAGAAAAWSARERAAHARSAAEGLASVVALGDRLGADSPAVTEAFVAYVASPEVADTPSLTEAWRWRAAHATGADRTSALVAAYASAPEDTTQAVLAELAEALLQERRWETFAAITSALPADARSDLFGQAALVRWRVGEPTEPVLTPFLSILPVPLGNAGRFLGDGFVLAEGRTFRLLDRAGAVTHTWEAPARIRDLRVDGEWIWVLHEAGFERVHLPDLRHEALLTGPGPFGPFDVVGADLYVGQPYPQRTVRVVKGGSLIPVDPSFDAAQIDIRAVKAVDIDADGHEELIVAGGGWRDGEVRVIEPTPGGARVRSRFRIDAGPVAFGSDRAGSWLVTVGSDPAGTPEPGHGLPQFLVRFDVAKGLALRDAGPFEGHVDDIWAVDLDGDGLDDVVTSDDGGGGSISLHHQLPNGRLAAPVWIPGLRVLDAIDGALWLSDGERGFWAGNPDGGPLPARAAPSAVAAVPVPPGLPADLERRWSRLELLASLGLGVEVGDALAALAATTSGTTARAALTRSHGLLAEAGSAHTAGVARQLVEIGALDAEQRAAVRDSLVRAHDLERLSRLGGVDELTSLGAEDTTLTNAGPLDARWRVLRPEAVRRRPLGDGIDVRATADRGALLELPLTWDGRALQVDLSLEVVSLDWAAGVEWAVQAGDWERTAEIWRVGGGPPVNHRTIAACVSGQKNELGPGDAPVTVRLALTYLGGSTPTFGCRTDAREAMTLPVPPAPSGDLRLVLRTKRDHQKSDGLAHIRVGAVRVRGATPAPDSRADEAHAFANGGDDAVRQAATGPDPLLAAVASALLGAPTLQHVESLSDGDLGFLLRTDPDAWASPIRAASPARFAALFDAAWAAPLGYGEAGEALLLPALADVPLDTAEGRRIALERVRVLLERPGRFLDAERGLSALRARADSPEAWWLTALLRVRSGDSAGAREALVRYFATTDAPSLAADRAQDDPDLAPLAPTEPMAAPRFSGER